MSKIHLIARDNGAGLSRDLQIVGDILAKEGFDVTASAIGAGGVRRQMRHWRLRISLGWRALTQQGRKTQFDAALSFERILPDFLGLARRNALIPNPEWFRPEYKAALSRIDRVFAKTRHAVPLFEALGCDTRFVGFTSVDRMRSDVAREPYFLHLAGRSGNKGTQALASLWQKQPSWPMLTIVQRRKQKEPARALSNIRFETRYLDESDVIAMANRHLFHLCPSETEGFGHNICEGMSVGPVMLTTDAPPMNELVTADRGILVKYGRTGTQRLATTYFVEDHALADGVERMLSLDEDQRRAFRESARAWYEANDRDFRSRIVSAVADLASQ